MSPSSVPSSLAPELAGVFAGSAVEVELEDEVEAVSSSVVDVDEVDEVELSHVRMRPCTDEACTAGRRACVTRGHTPASERAGR